jgi:large subunit ribosomal protein L25
MAKTIAAELRTQIQKGANNRLRHTGRIPAVVYGHEAPVHVHINAHDFSNQFKKISESEIVTLELGKKKHNVLIKDYQRNILKGTITHIDFYEVSKDHVLKTHVPLLLGNVNDAIRAAGAMVELSLHELEVECLPAALPESIIVDASELSLEHAIHVRDLKLPKGVKVLNSGDQVVVHAGHVRAEIVTPAAVVAEATPAQ